MKRRGMYNSVVALFLTAAIILSVAAYAIVTDVSITMLSNRQSFGKVSSAVKNFQNDFEKALTTSAKRGIIALTQHLVETQTFTNDAPSTIREVVIWGTYNGKSLTFMKDSSLVGWFSTTITNLNKMGIVIEPNDPTLLAKNLELNVYQADAFSIAFEYRLNNVVIRDTTGNVVFRGSIPAEGYGYVRVSITGLEDPYLVVSLSGKYTRLIIPSELAVYGKMTSGDVLELARSKEYIPYDNGMTFLERLEGSMRNHAKYISGAQYVQSKLGYTSYVPAGLLTFLVPDKNYDELLYSTLKTLGVGLTDQPSDDYHFISWYVYRKDRVRGCSIKDADTTAFYISPSMALDIIGSTDDLVCG